MSELTGIVTRHCRIFSGSRDDRCSVREERPGTGGNSRHRAPAEAARAFSSGCSGGAAASIWAAAAFTPRRFASVKLLARASFRHHGVCSQTRTRQMLSGGWMQMPDAQKRGARAGHARALVRVVQARRSPGVGSGAYVSPEAAVPRSLSLPLAPQRSAPRPEAAAVPPRWRVPA